MPSSTDQGGRKPRDMQAGVNNPSIKIKFCWTESILDRLYVRPSLTSARTFPNFRMSIGLSLARTFPHFDSYTRKLLSKQMPGFTPNSDLCAEFLRVLYAKPPSFEFDAKHEMYMAWAQHAMATLSATSEMRSFTKQWETAPSGPSFDSLQFYGYLIEGRKVRILVMSFTEDGRQGADHKFQVELLAEIELWTKEAPQRFVEWHIQIVTSASVRYYTPYVHRLSNEDLVKKSLECTI
ncbi:MAG: hypothetical protein Q9201_000116 [Fulgogasparrea decipioides]